MSNSRRRVRTDSLQRKQGQFGYGISFASFIFGLYTLSSWPQRLNIWRTWFSLWLSVWGTLTGLFS